MQAFKTNSDTEDMAKKRISEFSTKNRFCPDVPSTLQDGVLLVTANLCLRDQGYGTKGNNFVKIWEVFLCLDS